MPHQRYRQGVAKLSKKLKFFPVVAIQGARQTGKSVLARDLLPQELGSVRQVSFDQPSVRLDAAQSIEAFLTRQGTDQLVVIDEAQKVPEVFDAIKYIVDRKRTPGQYLLLGSTEFSRLTQVRESLTGRMGRIRFFPLTLAEAYDRVDRKNARYTGDFTREELLQYADRGGMPGIFSVRSEEGRTELIQDWIDLTCQRDIFQFKGIQLDSEIAYGVLRQATLLEFPTQAEIARQLRLDTRHVSRHLQALCGLFVLQKVEPHPSGGGKPIFLPFDSSIAVYFDAPLKRRLQICALNELLARNSYIYVKKHDIHYYRSTSKRMIDLVDTSRTVQASQIFDSPRVRKTDVAMMKAFLAKNPGAQGALYAPVAEARALDGVSVRPWEEFYQLAVPNL